MNTRYDYSNKIIGIEEALARINSNDLIISAMAAAEPRGILEQLHTIADRVENVAVSTCLPLHNAKWYSDPAMKGHFINHSWFHTPSIRKAAEFGTCTLVPCHLNGAGMDRLRYRKPNVFLGTCTPPDRFGFVSLSLSATYERELLDAADIVILEMNEQTPWTYGDTVIHLDSVDFIVENSYPLPQLPVAESDDRDRRIGGYIGELIEDGSSIQLGIGGIPNAVSGELLHKKGLSIHTEMFTDGMVDLYEAGAIAKTASGLDHRMLAGKMVATFALGSQRLYDFMHHNPAVAVMRGSWVNNSWVIAHNPKQVSINTTLEIDLTGQVCSESIGHKQFSGSGGQADTAIGAQMSDGGKSFIALYSTAEVKQADGTRKTISKIAPMLTHGAVVTLHRANVDYVVTEFGIVRLKGAPVDERARLLISIAHPDFRAGLQDAAERLGFL